MSKKYQIGIFDRGGETWHFYREDFNIVAFDSLESAETKAMALSRSYAGSETLVLTLHGCFKTETEYPRPDPIQRTQRINFLFVEARENIKENGTLPPQTSALEPQG